MTQPVQEPTQGRVNQAEAFRQRQLYRRPSPAGIGSQWLHLVRETDTTVGASSSYRIQWESMETSSTDVFTTTDAGGANPNTINNDRLTLTALGTYLIQARVDWQSTATDCHLTINNDQFGYRSYSQYNPSNPAGGQYSYVASTMVFLATGFATSLLLSLSAVNGSGSSYDVTQASMQIIYWASTGAYVNPY